MASDAALSSVLAFLQELCPTRDIGAHTLDAWAIAFEDYTDAELSEYARKAAIEPGRKFFPTPGEIAAYRVVPTVDAGRVLRQISALGAYNPHGRIYPSIERVREAMGSAVAEAYAAAGAERCFADDGSFAQDSARRTFAAELKPTQAGDEVRRLPAATPSRRALGAGNGDGGRDP